MTGCAVWVFAATGCTVMEGELRADFAVEIPMSQVMPDTGVAATDVGLLPELTHQPAIAMLAQSANPRLIRGARIFPVVATGFCLIIGHSGPIQKFVLVLQRNTDEARHRALCLLGRLGERLSQVSPAGDYFSLSAPPLILFGCSSGMAA